MGDNRKTGSKLFKYDFQVGATDLIMIFELVRSHKSSTYLWFVSVFVFVSVLSPRIISVLLCCQTKLAFDWLRQGVPYAILALPRFDAEFPSQNEAELK